MFNDISNFTNVTARRGLYQVWIRAQEHENARLVAVWIDPQMRAFEPQPGNERDRLPKLSSQVAAAGEPANEQDGFPDGEVPLVRLSISSGSCETKRSRLTPPSGPRKVESN